MAKRASNANGGTSALAPRSAKTKKIRAPYLVSEEILERARAVVYHYGEGLTMAKLGEEGLRLAIAKYEKAYEKERGRPVPPLPEHGQLPRGPR